MMPFRIALALQEGKGYHLSVLAYGDYRHVPVRTRSPSIMLCYHAPSASFAVVMTHENDKHNSQHTIIIL